MNFTKEQKKEIMNILEDYQIILVSGDDSDWNNIQEVSEEYFFEKIEEALENVKAK